MPVPNSRSHVASWNRDAFNMLKEVTVMSIPSIEHVHELESIGCAGLVGATHERVALTTMLLFFISFQKSFAADVTL